MIVCTSLTVQQSQTQLLLENVNFLNRYAQSDNELCKVFAVQP